MMWASPVSQFQTTEPHCIWVSPVSRSKQPGTWRIRRCLRMLRKRKLWLSTNIKLWSIIYVGKRKNFSDCDSATPWCMVLTILCHPDLVIKISDLAYHVHNHDPDDMDSPGVKAVLWQWRSVFSPLCHHQLNMSIKTLSSLFVRLS